MRRAAQKIVEKLRAHGHEAFFAGGWVRDHLLSRKPKDIDIATSALPEEVVGLFSHSLPLGAQFGVVQVRMYGRAYDVATFRSEGPYLDGRHPSRVIFSGPRQDALRRDFTVNGLFYDPAADRVIDYVHGRADIRKCVLRTIGKPQERFREDKLRMLRAIRFACSLDFQIAADTWEAVEQLAPAILEVSWERIRDEVLKIISGPAPGRGLELLHQCRLLAHILPEVEATVGVEQPPEFHPEGDVYTHTKNTLERLRKPTPVLALAALLHDVGKPVTFSVRERIRFDGHVEEGARIADDVCRRLRMSNDDTARITSLIRNHLRFMEVHHMRPGTLKRFVGQPDFEDHLELHRADCLGSHGNLDSYRFAQEHYERYRNEAPPPAKLISGDDLIGIGYRQGPVFRRILETVEDWRAENPALTREEILKQLLLEFPLESHE